MVEKFYSFKFQNVKAMRYLSLMLLPFPFIPLMGANVGVVIFLLVIMGPMVLGIVLAILKGKAEDIICIKDTYFESSYFGDINYDDILRISSPMMYPKPCIQLKLNNGQKVTWILNYQSNVFNNKEDVTTFLAFIEALEQQIKNKEAKNSSAKPAGLELEEKTSNIDSVSEDQNLTSLTEQLEGVKKKNNMSKWAIPIGLAFAVLALVRTCGTDWFRSGDFNGPEMAKNSEKIFQHRSAEAKLVLGKLARQSGPYFLYSNDTSASLTLLPDLDMDNRTGISAFDYVTANKSLEAFIEHPDSAKLDLYVIGKGKSMGKLSKSALNSYDSTKTYLYFRAYDPTLLIPSSSPQDKTNLKDTGANVAFDVSTGIPLYDTHSLGKAISKAFPGMNMMLANAKLRPSSYKLYLAARTDAGMDEAIFRKAVRELNKQMNAVKVDTSTFKLKIFNKNF
ncbi:hypothetical protein [Pedobacter cryoconitis]|uniref:Uncharacterized protein n=1 Tax=Pedobacter cryoconitis TaxID=188932 RepID=A0A7X0MJL0_9SPHI|nr:hypothetical protein [Pedobacter cryoconitis]MBB6501259.1 hypothetical protein [Pedobacter cryoconitis]